ncbi:hypothetical protein EI94DRAFT_1795514 [Lactarius quietus]|nr:hypothetical protein EI94DRAFT_1795514 [Lactarius quietus]
MIFIFNLTKARLLLAGRRQPESASVQVDLAADSQSANSQSAESKSESWFLFFLRGFMVFCWTALGKLFMAQFQSIVLHACHSAVAQLPGLAEQSRLRLMSNEAPGLVTGEQVSPARTTSPRRASWSYLRGVSLALSELCQDDNYGGNRIPLSAILDLMRQHQSAFVPLGPHVERDVPKRLIQLANEGVVIFNPFNEYVIVLRLPDRGTPRGAESC